MQRSWSAGRRGCVLSAWSWVSFGRRPLASLEAGRVRDLVATAATIALGALICALAAFITLQVVRRREAQQAVSAQ